ncbi:MAG: hypothetical protein II777_10630 [Clostridia bacterium]|nr:hypothetical protein [Clostridia bacterium]
MSLPSITHEITVGLGGETIYTRDFVYQYDNATDYFEVTIEGVSDLLIFGEGITVTYELMRDGQKILALKEYPCELLLTGWAITKVLCALPDEIRKHYGYWNGQIHLHLGENRKSSDVFVFSSLPGIRPSDKIPGKPSGASLYSDDFGLALEAKPSVVSAKQGEHSNGIGLTAGESDGDVVSAVQGEADSRVELSKELSPIVRLIVLAELNGKIGLESDLSGQDAAAVQGEHNGGVETESDISAMSANAEQAAIDTGAETDGLADGRVSRGYFTEYTDENAEALSAEGVTSDVVSAELSGKYAISLEAEATVITPTPPEYINAGNYSSNDDVLPGETWSVDMLFLYHEEGTGNIVVCNKMESKYEFVPAFQDYAWLLYFDADIVGIILGTAWFIFTHPDYPLFTVLQRTEVTAAQKAVFDRYFQLNT